MAFDLKDKVVLVTGGSIGIGAKVVEFLLEENVKQVANLDIAQDTGLALQIKLNEQYGADKVKFFHCDITNETQLSAVYDEVIKEQGYIDVVINNAGLMNDRKDKYKKEIETNVIALTTSTLKALELMRQDEGGKGGVVINISSIVALSQSPALPIYSGTKSYVLQFSNCMGLPEYYLRTGVRVIAVCFGVTETSLLSREKMGSIDKIIEDSITEKINDFTIQKVESAAQSLLEVIRSGESGSTWLSIADKPARDITEDVKNAYGNLTKLILE